MWKAGPCVLLLLVAGLLLEGVAEGYTLFRLDDDLFDNSYEDRYDNSREFPFSREDPRSLEDFYSREDIYSRENDNSLEYYGVKGYVPNNQGVPVEVNSQNGRWRKGPWGSINDGTGRNLRVDAVQPVGRKVFGDNSKGWYQQGWRRNLRQLVRGFNAVMLKFGAVVQEGGFYCIRRFEHAADQVRELLVFEKLEQELKEGHAEVAKFFQILGEKVRAWREKHMHVVRPLNVWTQEQDTQMPDFVQDDQVVDQLNKLKEAGVLTDDDVQILTQEHTSQKNFSSTNSRVEAHETDGLD